ncbi:unnamed protein product [Lepeophtheirus salmonis]|uniref:(salmon louse) hypothetical protein n=1 Tax=Lepeophtheirus salmonis TaxID=72036 RepID=A0A7R8H1T6_LEPSM|nr:unnamed protein product [Lepeophtheirus salmonis]CAF2799685.1 unnamed protein product [Lepeophtheirus salmonis]
MLQVEFLKSCFQLTASLHGYEGPRPCLSTGPPSKKAQVTTAVNSINNEARIRFRKVYESLEDYYMELMNIDPRQTDEYNTQLEEYYTKYQETLEKLLDNMSFNEQPAEPTLNKPPEPSSSIIHIDNSSLSFNLTKDHNPHELAEWIGKFIYEKRALGFHPFNKDKMSLQIQRETSLKNITCKEHSYWSDPVPTYDLQDILTILLFSTLHFSSIIFNTLWILVLYRKTYKIELNSTTRFILLTLCYNVILLGLLVISTSLYTLLTKCWPYGSFLCKIQAVLHGGLSHHYVSLIIIMAIDHYWRINDKSRLYRFIIGKHDKPHA